VVGRKKVIEVEGKKVRGRKYKWGVVEVEKKKNSDLIKIRKMMI
jgi:septin 7